MLSVTQRGKVWRIEGKANGQYIRLSLSTRDERQAHNLRNKIHEAVLLGPECNHWPELKKLLPEKTFAFFAGVAGWQEKSEPLEPPAPTWAELIRDFTARFRRQILQGERSEATWKRYELTFDVFEGFLTARGISRLEDITRRVTEEFKAWKLAKTLERKHSRNGAGLKLDIAILHGVFAFAIEMELLVRNPVKSEGTPGRKPDSGAQPFNQDQLTLLRKSAGPDLLSFLLLRHTGLRGFDATDLRWSDLDLRDRMLSRLTHKRAKQVWIPLHQELLFALEAEFAKRDPLPGDHVLINPDTKKPMSRPRLYTRIKALGERAGVDRTHPHRFRDTLAVDMLLKGATPYDVAKTLGDTVAVVEKHYAPYVKELRERTRKIMASDEGIEKEAPNNTVFAHQPPMRGKVQ
jgi:integrase/recombinase XerD